MKDKVKKYGDLKSGYLSGKYQIAESCEKEDPEPSPGNTTFFKLGFGGKIKLLPGAYCYFFNPIVRTVMKCGFSKLLDSGVTQRLAQIYAQRTK